VQIVKVVYTRKFNKGNYESEDVTYEAQLLEGESANTILCVLKNMSEEWHRHSLSKIEEKTPTPSIPTPPQKPVAVASPPQAKEKITVQDAERHLHEYVDKLSFSDNGYHVIVKPKAFLGSDVFAEINVLVYNVGGKYVSDPPKNSRWQIPMETAK
jgi:hypothetical protein